MKKSFIICSVFLLSCINSLLSQQVSISDNGTQPIKLTTCQENGFSLKLSRTTFASQDTTIVVFHLKPGIDLINTGTNLNILQINDSSFQITGISASSIIVDYKLKPKCGFFSANTISGIAHHVDVEYNRVSQVFNPIYKKEYSIDAPFVVFSSSLSRNLNYSSADFEVPFTRSFLYVNTGSPSFSGEIVFEDTVRKNLNQSSIRFNSVNVNNPLSNITILQNNLTDTSVFLRINVTNLQTNDSIVIVENVTVIGCEKENSYTDFYLKYGCINEELCEKNQQSLTSTQAYLSDEKPLLVKYSGSFESGYNLLTPEYNGCLSDPHLRILELKNVGNGIASSLNFIAYGVSFFGPTWNYFSKIDTNSIQVFKLVNNVKVSVPFHKVGDIDSSRAAPIYNQYQQFFQEYAVDSLILPGDIYYVHFNELVKCLDESEYDGVFNASSRFSNSYMGAYLSHPCSPTPQQLVDPYNFVNEGGSQHTFSFKQKFENLDHPTVVDEEEIWLEINDNSVLNLGETNPGGFAFNLDSSELLIKIEVQPGFEIIEDSIFIVSNQGSQEIYLLPSLIEYIGNVVGDAGGGYALAHFAFPDSFYVATPLIADGQGRTRSKYYGNKSNPTPYFTQFFNDFKVIFKLKAHCQKAVGSIAKVEQSFFFVPNKFCDPTCKIPITKVFDNIKFLCPGCILPGFNVSQFNFNRINVGYADDDDNHLPDQIPFTSTVPDESKLKRKHVLIGDTIQIDITANTSDGQNYTFDNIGIDLDEGQVFIVGDFLKNLTFIGAEAKFNGQDFTIPASAGVFSDETFATPNNAISLFSINVGSAALASYGITGVSKFDNGDVLEIHPIFVVRKNLILGTGGNKLYSVEELNSFVYMSGNPFTGFRQRDDANEYLKPVPTDSFAALSAPERENLDYWCTGGIARLLGVGVSFYLGPWDGGAGSNYVNFNHYQSGHPFESDYLYNPCYKIMNQANYIGIGEDHGSYYYPFQTRSLLDAFPFELRNLWKKNAVALNFPGKYYEVEKVLLDFGTVLYNSASNATGYDRYVLRLDVNGNPNITVTDSLLNVNLLPYYKQTTEQENEPGYFFTKDSLLAFDEGSINDVYYVLKMKDCKIPDSVSASGYEMKDYYSDFILAEGRDTAISRSYQAPTFFDKPSAKLILNPSNFNSIDGKWDVRLETKKAFEATVDDYINNSARNSFMYFVSPSGSITVNSVTNGSTNLTVEETINGLPLFGVGFVGSKITSPQSVKADLRINTTFNCTDVDKRDSLMVIYGWNCYGYPTSLENVCFIDTTWLYIDILETGLQGELIGEENLNSCATQEYKVKLHPTGTGNVENIQIDLNIPAEFSYVTGSGRVEQATNSESIEPSGTPMILNWDLDSISFLLNQFNASSQSSDAFLIFELSSTCGAGTFPINVEVNSTNYCGKALPKINLTKQITSSTANSSEILEIDPSGICDSLGTINLTISNGSQSIIDLNIYSAVTGDSIGSLHAEGLSDNSINVYTVPVSSNDTNLFFVWKSCSCSDTLFYDFTCQIPCPANAAFIGTTVCVNEQLCFKLTDSTMFEPNFNHLWNFGNGMYSNSIEPCFTFSTVGTYPITHIVYDYNGDCSDTVTMNIVVSPTPSGSIELLGCNPFCTGDTVYLAVNGVYDSITWVQVTNNTTVVVGSGDTLTVTTGGVYNAVLHLGNCIDSCLAIRINPQPTPNININDTVVCSANETVTLNAGAGYNHYLWSNGATTQTITVGPGTYTVEVGQKLNFGCCLCTAVDTVVVRLNDLNASLQDTTICRGDSISISPSVTGGIAPYTYLWNTGATSSTISIDSSGVYSVLVTDAIGCKDSASMTVNLAAPSDASFNSSDSICLSETACFVALNSGTDEWNIYNGSTLVASFGDIDTICYQFPNNGTYTITHILTSLCGTDTVSHTIIVTSPSINISDTLVCSASDSVTLNVGNGYDSYSWSNGATTQTTSVVAGTYVITVGNYVNGVLCTASDTVIVGINDLNVSLNDTTICDGVSITLSPIITGGIPPYKYLWSTGASTATINVSAAGTYNVAVSDALGCTDSAFMNLNVIYHPDPSISYDDTICVSDTACFSANGVGINKWNIYSNNGNLLASFGDVSEICFQFSNAGKYTVEHIISNSCFSDTSRNTIVVVPPVQACIVMIGSNPFCAGETVLLTINDPFNQVNLIDWYRDSVFVGTSDTLVVTQGGTYTAMIHDANGCTNACMCIVLTQIPVNNNLGIPDNAYVCGGSDTETLTANAGFTSYTWRRNGDIVGNNQSLTVSTAGTYTLEATNANGCIGRDTTIVLLRQISGKIKQSEISVCRGQYSTITVTCDPNFTYLWEKRRFGIANTYDPIAGTACVNSVYTTYLGINNYRVTITDTLTGCSRIINFSITEIPGICNGIVVSPNPTINQHSTVYYTLANRGIVDAKIEVFNMMGAKTKTHKIDVDLQEFDIDFSGYAEGIYIIRLICDGEIMTTERVVISK